MREGGYWEPRGRGVMCVTEAVVLNIAMGKGISCYFWVSCYKGKGSGSRLLSEKGLKGKRGREGKSEHTSHG